MRKELIDFAVVSIIILMFFIILYLGIIGTEVLKMRRDCEQIGLNRGAMNSTFCSSDIIPTCIELKGSVYCKQK